jgi:hypothetical protein
VGVFDTTRLGAWAAAHVRGVLTDEERALLDEGPGSFAETVLLDVPGRPRRGGGGAGLLERLDELEATSAWPTAAPGGGAEAAPVSAAFAGAGGWMIAAATPSGVVAWTLSDTPIRPRLRRGRAWRHAWREHPPRPGSCPVTPDLDALAGRLRGALVDARRLASEPDLDTWMRIFDDAIRILDGEPVPPAGAPLVLPAAFPPAAQRLHDAAVRAWVFGGMGSWNDVGPGGSGPFEREYVAVTRALYAADVSAALGAASALL